MLFRRVYAEFFSRRHIESTHCLRESKRSCRSCACAPGASEPYVADNTDKKLADGGVSRRRTCDSCDMRCRVACVHLHFVLYMRNTVKTYKTMHLLRDTEIRRNSQQVRRKNIGGHGRDTTQAVYNTV